MEHVPLEPTVVKKNWGKNRKKKNDGKMFAAECLSNKSEGHADMLFEMEDPCRLCVSWHSPLEPNRGNTWTCWDFLGTMVWTRTTWELNPPSEGEGKHDIKRSLSWTKNESTKNCCPTNHFIKKGALGSSPSEVSTVPDLMPLRSKAHWPQIEHPG